MRIVVVTAAVFGLLASSAGAQQSGGAPRPDVKDAWARASFGPTGAAYFSVTNHGGAADRLVALRTPVAAKAELHEDKIDNGVMKMRLLKSLTIASGQSVVLKPGTDHVMLTGLKQPLKQGESFPLTLTFEKGGDVQVMVRVEGAGAMGATGHGSMPQMDHGSMK